jgi:hypothetical protein
MGFRAQGYGEPFYPPPYMAAPRVRMPWMHQHPWAFSSEQLYMEPPDYLYGSGYPYQHRMPHIDAWGQSSAFEWEREFEAKLADVLDQNRELAARLEASQQPPENEIDARLEEVLEQNRELAAQLEAMQQPHPAEEEEASPMEQEGMGMDPGLETEAKLAAALDRHQELMAQLRVMQCPPTTPNDTEAAVAADLLERNRELVEQLQDMQMRRPTSGGYYRRNFNAPPTPAWGPRHPFEGSDYYATAPPSMAPAWGNQPSPFSAGLGYLIAPPPPVAALAFNDGFDDGYRTGFDDGFQNAATMAPPAWEPRMFLDGGGFNSGYSSDPPSWGQPPPPEFGGGGYNRNAPSSTQGWSQPQPPPPPQNEFEGGGYNRNSAGTWSSRPYEEPKYYQQQEQQNRFQNRYNEPPAYNHPSNQRSRFEQSGSNPFIQEEDKVAARRKSRLKDHFF